MSNQLFAAALSAATQTRIISYDDFKNLEKRGASEGYKSLDPYAVHQTQLMMGPVFSDNPIPPPPRPPVPHGKRMLVLVRTLSGDRLNVACDEGDTVEQFKRAIQATIGTPISEQIISFNARPMKNHEILFDHNVTAGSILHLSKDPPLLYVQEDLRAPQFDYDLTKNYKLQFDTGTTYKQSKYYHRQPIEWTRFGLNVLDRFEDNAWLGGGRAKGDEMGPDEWPISYHGTGLSDKLRCGAQDGFRFCKQEPKKRPRRHRRTPVVPTSLFSHGVFTTPEIVRAEPHAATFIFDGDTYKVVMQNRVNPKTVVMFPTRPTDVEYWISPNEQDVRPFGICVKKI